MGSSLKMVMNQMLGTVMAAFSEGLVLGEALGLPRKALLDALLDGAAGANAHHRVGCHHDSAVQAPREAVESLGRLPSICVWQEGRRVVHERHQQGASNGEHRKTTIAATPEIANQDAWRANSSPTRSAE